MPKIKITGKGLPKAQYQNSQVGYNPQLTPFNISMQAPAGFGDIFKKLNPGPLNFTAPQAEMPTLHGYQSATKRSAGDFGYTSPGPFVQNPDRPNFVSNLYNRLGQAQEFLNTDPTARKVMGAAQTAGAILDFASPVVSMINERKRGREIDRAYRQSLLTQTVSGGKDRGDYEINTGMLDPYNTGFKSKGQFTDNLFPSMAQDGLEIPFMPVAERRYIPESIIVEQGVGAPRVTTPAAAVSATPPTALAAPAPLFKVSGKSGTANMHPWAVNFGNDLQKTLGKQLTLNSVYRDPGNNSRVGGKKNSFHLSGAALDLDPSYWRSLNKSQQQQLLSTYNAEAIDEGDHVHIEPRDRSALQYTTVAPQGATAAVRHNNPGNIHYGSYAKKFGAQPGSEDNGGKIAVFPDLETGMRAFENLLFGDSYGDLTVSQARNKWVNGNPNVATQSSRNIVQAVGGDYKLNELTVSQRKKLMEEFSKFEDRNMYNTLKSLGVFEQGGQTKQLQDMKYKIRITAAPQEQMAYGGQKNHALDLGKSHMVDERSAPYDQVGNTLGPVPREQANIEAEKGETVYGDIDQDGINEHMKIGGKRHSEGGTPLNVPSGSFIYSDTAKMRIKNPDVLRSFGLGTKKGGYTPAEIAKRYDVNKYKAILEDPRADKMQKDTAQMMIGRYEQKLAQLALVQEGMKGFPQGIPQVAEQEAVRMGMVDPQQEMAPQEQSAEEPQMRMGGDLPQYQGDTGGSTVSGAFPVPSWLRPSLFTSANSPKGYTTPTKKDSRFTNDPASIYTNYNYWRQRAGRDFRGPDDYQDFVYNQHLQYNKPAVDKMWQTFGMTNAGKFADGRFGARSMNLIGQTIPVAPVKTPSKRSTSTYTPGEFEEGAADIPYSWTQQDMNNLGLAARNAASVRKISGQRYDVAPVLPTPRFMDWRGKAAELQGQYNNTLNTMGAYGSPTALAANASFMAGQQAENLINRGIMPTELANVETANRMEGIRAGVMNDVQMYNTRNKDLRSQDQATMLQNFINAKRAADIGLTRAMNQGITNAAGMYNTNITESPYYYINPLTGVMKFNSPASRAAFEAEQRNGFRGSSPTAGLSRTIEELDKGLMNVIPDAEERREFILRYIGGGGSGGRTSSYNYPYDPRKNRTVVTQPTSNVVDNQG